MNIIYCSDFSGEVESTSERTVAGGVNNDSVLNFQDIVIMMGLTNV